MRLYIVDAFTEVPFGGNTAGVVLLNPSEGFPEDEWMRQLAAELRYSETAFIRRDGPAEFTVRYFTPAGEIDLCGHATIASFGVMSKEGIVPEGTLCLNHTRAGDLEVLAGEQVMMQMAPSRIVHSFDDERQLDEILSAMGGMRREELGELPVEAFSTGLPDILLPMRDVAALQALNPDMPRLSVLSEKLGVVGVHAFAFGHDGYTAHVRNFAPLYDIPEESATGTSNAAFTGYLLRHGIIAAGDSCIFLQGEAMGRPSIIPTRVQQKNGAPDIRVGGPCAIVAAGDIRR